MTANYTDKQVGYMVKTYKGSPNRDTVNILAEELNKSVKSIIGKLSREGVYQKAVYTTKTGEMPITKAELIINLALRLNLDSSKLMGLEKAPKQAIKYLFDNVGETNG